MFDTTTYLARREALRAAMAARGISSGLVLILGNNEAPCNYFDNGYPFRQDSTFLYFIGLDLPGHAATIDLESGDVALYADDLSIDDIVWTGPQPTMAELASQSGISEVRPRAGLSADASATHAPLLFWPPYRADARAELAHILGRPYAEVDALASLPLVRASIELREIKSQAEVAEIEGAVSTTVAMHRAAVAMARPGMLEREIAARVTEISLAGGGGLSFPVIATIRGATLHNHYHGNTLSEGDLLLLDCGAEASSGYAGDLTTTFPVSKRFDSRQRDIYAIVLAAHARACSMIRPGVAFRDAHLAALRELAVGLSALGIMKGDPDEAVASGAVAGFMPCGLGHMMGLDVHDMENYGEVWVGYDGQTKSAEFGLKSLRLAKPLKAGMVHTVEPGVYFIPELLSRWKSEGRFAAFIDYAAAQKWIGFGGIRNEEDWLVTDTGGRRLGPAFDKSAAAIEALREGKLP